MNIQNVMSQKMNKIQTTTVIQSTLCVLLTKCMMVWRWYLQVLLCVHLHPVKQMCHI